MAVEAELLSLADVRAAASRIQPYVLRTPTLSGETVAGPGVWLKAENLQRTGSFKVRGAVNAVLQLSPDQRRRLPSRPVRARSASRSSTQWRTFAA